MSQTLDELYERLDDWFQHSKQYDHTNDPIGAPASSKEANPVEAASATAAPRGKAEIPVEKETRDQLLARLLDPVLTLEEAAQVLSVCPTTVRRYTNKGLLKHYRTSGNQRRFRLSHVLSFMEDLGDAPNTGTLEEASRMLRPSAPSGVDAQAARDL